MHKLFCLFLIIMCLSQNTQVKCNRFPSRRGSKQDVQSPTKSVQNVRLRSDAYDSLFNVYDPSFLAVVWSKLANGMHLALEKECWKDLSVFFRDLEDGRAWAYTVIDATGRYEPGLFGGNKYWLGSKKQCLKLNELYSVKSNVTVDALPSSDYFGVRKEKYFDSAEEDWRSLTQREESTQAPTPTELTTPVKLSYSTVQLSINLTKPDMLTSYDVILGVCLPELCSPQDITSLINFSILINDKLKSNRTVPRNVRIISTRHVDSTYNIGKDFGTIVLISISILLALITIVATAIDLDWIKCRPRHTVMSFDLQKYNNNSDNEIRSDEELKTLPRKEMNVEGMETLTINNINNSNNINMVTVKKVMKPNSLPPSITLDVVQTENVSGSCIRCGKYKKQCPNPRQLDNLPACPRMKYNNSFASLSTEVKNKDSLLRSLFLCFSLRYSWKRIFNTNMANKDLALIHVFKIVATIWVIYVHVAVITNYVSENGGDINERNGAFYVLTTGTLAFDTLFFVSGLLSAHHFFYLQREYSVEELVSFGGACGQVLQVVCFITNRAVRLLPAYAYAIFLSGTLARVSRSTSAVVLPENDDFNCENYWWQNLLYINIYRPQERCMQISWFLSTETQLHAAAAVLCGASVATNKRVVAVLLTTTLLATTAADVAAAYEQFTMHMYSVFAGYGVIIERPWARVAPYFVGVLAGWLVHRADGRIRVSKVTYWCLWVASTLTLIAGGTLPWAWPTWAAAACHAAWPVALLWPTILAATKHADKTRRLLNSPLVAGLSRLCYCTILLHGAVARYLLLSADSSLSAHVWSYFVGTTATTLLSALVLSLVVEMPCCSLLRRISDCANGSGQNMTLTGMR